MNILIIDSREILREGVAEMVRGCMPNATVTTASSGLSAMQAADAGRLDMVILDVELAEMSGIETAKRLRQAHPLVKPVFLTEQTDPTVARHALDAGAKGYLLKHEQPDILTQAIHRIANGETIISEPLRHQIPDANAANQAPQPAGFASLTKRQAQILAMVASGLSAREIASLTGLASKTVDTHRRSIGAKLGVDTTADYTRIAIREGLVSLDGEILEQGNLGQASPRP